MTKETMFDFNRSVLILGLDLNGNKITIHTPSLQKNITVNLSEIDFRVEMEVPNFGAYYDPQSKIIGFKTEQHLNHYRAMWGFKIVLSA